MSHSNLRLWRVSIYAAAIAAAAGIVGSIKPPAAVAVPRIPGVPGNVEAKADIYVKSTVGSCNLKSLNLPLAQKLNDKAVVNNQVVYELGGGAYKGGPSYEIDVYKSGKLDEVELRIANNQYKQAVPAAARNLIARKVPGFTPTIIEKSCRPVVAPKFNSNVVYELEGKNNKGQVVEVDVNPNGTYIEVTTPTF